MAKRRLTILKLQSTLLKSKRQKQPSRPPKSKKQLLKSKRLRSSKKLPSLNQPPKSRQNVNLLLSPRLNQLKAKQPKNQTPRRPSSKPNVRQLLHHPKKTKRTKRRLTMMKKKLSFHQLRKLPMIQRATTLFKLNAFQHHNSSQLNQRMKHSMWIRSHKNQHREKEVQPVKRQRLTHLIRKRI